MSETGSTGRSRTVGVLSHAVPTYIGAVLLIAVVLAAMGWRSHPLNRGDVVALVVLCVMGILSESVRENDVGRRTTLSFTSIVLLSSVALIGPFGAAVVGTVTWLLGAQQGPGSGEDIQLRYDLGLRGSWRVRLPHGRWCGQCE